MDPQTTSGEHRSCWLARQPSPLPPLTTDAICDTCIVGGGIAGLATAYRLAAEGRDVLLIDDGRIGSGETGRTSAHLASALDDRFTELERLHGPEGARVAYESHAAAIDWIEGVAADEGIDCGFARVDGWLFAPPGDSHDLLTDELAAARRSGLVQAELVERIPGVPFDSGPALRFPDQAELHPLAFLAGLAAAAARAGARLHGGTHAVEIAGGANPRVRTAGGATIRARSIVVATNVPVNDRVAVHTKLEPYRTYVIALRVARGAVPHGLYWDTPDPYHYVRVAAEGDGELLLVGGEDHEVGDAVDQPERYARLEAWARRHFPQAGAVAYRWSGQVIEPIDALAYIGRNPGDDDVYIVAGDSGNGLTHGVVGALIIGDLILGRPNHWAKTYSPSRKPLRAAGEFTRHNAHVAAQYRDWLTGGGAEDAIAPGSGAVVRHGLAKRAVYRDPAGVRHACSAVCPHLRGVVRWNADEGTWDCPAHGSRFDPLGRVVNGPANRDLHPAEGAGADPAQHHTAVTGIPEDGIPSP